MLAGKGFAGVALQVGAVALGVALKVAAITVGTIYLTNASITLRF